MEIKYRLLKVIDTTGLSFLSPVVRLAAGEEPRKQLKDIGRWIIVPVFAMVLFGVLWSIIAPRHKTKSGEVPTPAVVLEAWDGISRFHDNESAKEEGFQLTGDSRLAELKQAVARLSEVESLEVAANQRLKEVRESTDTEKLKIIAPFKSAYDAKSNEYRDYRKSSAARLKQLGDTLLEKGESERLAYLADMRAVEVKTEELKAERDALKVELEAAEEQTFPDLKEALKASTLLGEEKQFLIKYIDLVGESSREFKLAAAQETLKSSRQEFLTSTEGDLYKLCGNVIKNEKFTETIGTSQYAKPWTLPKQIVRSLFCVFTGFLLASIIAIPIGILCGLSNTFMAAMTPFIALFKPVSPLVWLPIVMIIVGGFMPDPDNHWLIVALAKVPILKEYKIDPMFLSSAITVALCSLWATLVNTALGVGSIDKDHLNVARVLRLGFFARLFKIIIPTALPLIFAGLRISLGVGWMVLVAAEILSTSEGIGKFVNDMYTNGSAESFAQIFVVVFIVGFIGMVLDRIMVFLQRLVSFDTSPAL